MARSKQDILQELKDRRVRFLRLQFTDILGLNKVVELPANQFEKALDGEIVFDGSSIEGFGRSEEESDMLLRPDYNTFVVYPEDLEPSPQGPIARLICDIAYPDGKPFEGDPRQVLKRQIERLQNRGFDNLYVGSEVEFFLFTRSPEGNPTIHTPDRAGYFDLAPTDRGEVARRAMVDILHRMGLPVEAAHHEGAPGQHEIDLKHTHALEAADFLATFKFVAKRVAIHHGLHATFMPKPIAGINGSGLHFHLSLFKGGENAFFEPRGSLEAWPHQLSPTALQFIAGLFEQAEGLAAITNPLVNSYKRLTPGYEAPTMVAWSVSHRNAMIRIPKRRGPSTRAEFRLPDPACNPYLALAVILAAGLYGLENRLTPPPPIERDVYDLSVRDRRKYRVSEMPGTLREALEALQKNRVVREALGDRVYKDFLQAKRVEWGSYRTAVHQWELEQYLAEY
ncbi:type I glutamate--ammonia ligase [Meiothermus sp. QL-1]|uniref:type I glutamate--ammonia ligase n=1 Tax=Meiothermus sp. QL-1 TaxID=2058095 RepID=UPI000E0B52F9|nr:type I glutamate--ammonia ligase [Meiothermus sp. QL-1]RDI96695.1 type I glutamate--ammonia ligase [Meiothermus sp. QL-1]